MTVKLGKLFGTNSSNNSTTHNKMSSPPPLPPPNPSLSCNYYNANTNQHHHQLQQKSQRAFNPYVDEMEDDNISLYSTTASIITARDHPYNNSQRPLLADRKPQLLLGSNASNNKKKTKNQTAANQQSSPKLSQNHHQQQQQQQPQQQQQQQQQQQEQKQKPEQKSYISPYVQQQKRDSVKGLHGFNDFDILSQQYNKHLQSPHIGYPYGSPPSPNSNSTAVDFVFDSAESTTTPIYRNNYASISTPLTVTTCYGNAVCDYGSTLATSATIEVNEIDYYRSNTNVDAINKLSRFEDDFCNRRNINFSKIDKKLTTSDDTNLYEGPFIFGIPPEQQTDFTRLGINGRSFDDITSCKAVLTNNGKQKLDKSMKQTVTQTSNSDTSSTTRDDSSTSNDSNGDPKGATKFLLRKRKTKKITKEGKPFNVVVEKPTIKCVLVGDCAVGKTNLILSYLENRFNTEHIPTASDIYNADVMVNDSPVHLTLCDTAGQDTLDPLRELCYPDSDVFLLCFSIAKPKTFHAIKNKWAPKFAKTKASLILVGTQADLRNNPNVLNKLQSNGEKPISHADAWDLATTIGAKYIETSSATQDKVKEVFDTAIWEGLAPTNLPPTPPPLWKKLFCLV